MSEKAIPVFMKEYMENIGHESYADYQVLSQQYHKTKQAYHEFQFPKRVPVTGRFTPQQDVQADMYRLEEQFKGRALDVACKYGYKDPGYNNYDRDLSARQEHGSYGNLSQNDFDLSPEDMRAQKAHAAFEKEHPDKTGDRKVNREIIDYYFSGPEGRELSQQPPEKEVKEKEQKEPLSREQLLKGFSQNKDDISTDKDRDRFMRSLDAIGREENNNPGLHNKTIDRDEMEME